jgi:hypothetical protein
MHAKCANTMLGLSAFGPSGEHTARENARREQIFDRSAGSIRRRLPVMCRILAAKGLGVSGLREESCAEWSSFFHDELKNDKGFEPL